VFAVGETCSLKGTGCIQKLSLSKLQSCGLEGALLLLLPLREGGDELGALLVLHDGAVVRTLSHLVLGQHLSLDLLRLQLKLPLKEGHKCGRLRSDLAFGQIGDDGLGCLNECVLVV